MSYALCQCMNASEPPEYLPTLSMWRCDYQWVDEYQQRRDLGEYSYLYEGRRARVKRTSRQTDGEDVVVVVVRAGEEIAPKYFQ